MWTSVRALALLALAGGCGTVAPRGAASDPQLAELAWLAGSWSGEERGTVSEEHWTLPAGGLMVGMHRDVSAAGSFFEALRIERRPDGIYYVAQPRGGAPTAFRLVERGRERAVFENPAHDHPRRILYWREGGVLRARIEGSEGGKPRASEWRWRPATLGR